MPKVIKPITRFHFGPQHPVLPEPIHLVLATEDERVVEVHAYVGFIHRGLELLCKKKSFTDMVYVAERICGICSFIHGVGYCQGIENIMQIEVPKRAEYLRVFWGELSRIHSHLLWMGLAADAIGFENLFMNSWKIRERILNIFEQTTGGRVIFNVCKVGGIRKDISDIELWKISQELQEIEKEYSEIANIFETDYTIASRWKGIGVLSESEARQLCAVGPTARASNICHDVRELRYGAYSEINFKPIVFNGGDCYARACVRVKEVFQSIDIIKQIISKIPSGDLSAKVQGFPLGECFSMMEQPRGEVVYLIIGDGTQKLVRFRVRTPTFANLAPLLQMLKNCDLADAPAIILSIDPCISCTER